ncbi:hypothetical protein [Sedimentitalea todarodis]|uniref:Uncharacterized protein n=1 Tax=Sedimentitalea todarodis TaxID=1631240 RepID=A0ABU3VLZ9_9RHOB|nr:hypothetical protein [Sedimentitalea todarodis]MDU9007221.1 hypothetical protein [Sedimentitalea todarodis]
MRVYSILFWMTAAATVWWCGMAFINGVVIGHYHRMAVLGDRLHVVRTGSISIPILVSLTMLALWMWRRPLSPRIYVLGIITLGFAAALPFLPRLESGYEQTYWLGEQRHSIPWVYAPFNGQSQPGGTYFHVRVRDMELTPYYLGFGANITIGKSSGSDYGKGGVAPKNDCESNHYNLKCTWKNGDYAYALSVEADKSPEDPQAFFRPIEKLLDSFETDIP